VYEKRLFKEDLGLTNILDDKCSKENFSLRWYFFVRDGKCRKSTTVMNVLGIPNSFKYFLSFKKLYGVTWVQFYLGAAHLDVSQKKCATILFRHFSLNSPTYKTQAY